MATDLETHLSAVDPGTAVLIAGPALTGKRRILYELLAGDRGDGRATMLTTTRKPDTKVASEYREVDPDLPDYRFAVVDCVSRERGRRTSNTDTRRYVTDAGDLTGIGIHCFEFLRQFHQDPAVDHVGVGYHTLSTTLMYASLKRVFQFVHVMTGRVSSSDFVGAFVVDTPVAGNGLDMLKTSFDALVETRDTDASPEFRTRGLPDAPRSWTSF